MTDDAQRPPEASFYDDPATADLTAKLDQAWKDFDHALATAIPLLPVGAVLELTLDPTASGVGDAVYAVSVSSAAAGELAAYAVSNAMLPLEHRLSKDAVGKLASLGWLPPQGTSSDSRFGLRAPSALADRVAAIMSRTMREVYGTPHPAFLMYRTQGMDAAAMPTLGAARPMTPAQAGSLPVLADLSAMPLPAKVAAVIAAMLRTEPENLPVDDDGDIGIRSGSAMVFVRVRDNPPMVDVFSPVLTDIRPSEGLFVRLSELTSRMPIGRLYATGTNVWASVPVFGRDFQPTHLMLAVQVMTGLSDELDDRLQGEFGGRRFFGEEETPAVTEPAREERAGPYL